MDRRLDRSQSGFRRQRFWLVVLVGLLWIVGAGITSTALLGASRAQASIAGTGACPDTVEAAEFADLGDLSDEASGAIDCVIHHGVSRGTSDTTFSPYQRVPRWQMALFLERAAEAIRVGLPLVTASPFVDIEDFPADTRLAIDRLVAAGFVNGTSPSTFDPLSNVSRWQMAVFLERLLDAAGVRSTSGEVRFTDLDGVPGEAVDAIAALDAIGIVRGTGADTYEPWGLVSRWEMAVFLSRVLEAGDADPVSLEISLSRDAATYVGGVIATISTNKPNGEPFPGVLVDVFVADSIESDGACRVDEDASVNGGDSGTSIDCTIDIGDPRSNSDGEVTVGLAHARVAETDAIYAWAGAPGEVFDADMVTTWISAELEWLAAPSDLTLSGPDSATFGGWAFLTSRLVGAGSGEPLIFEVVRDGATVLTKMGTTGSDGTAGWSYVGPPDPSIDDDPPVADTVTVFWDRNGNGSYDGTAEFSATRVITWDDAP